MIALVFVFVICLAASVIMAATRRQAEEPIMVMEPARKKKKQKVRSYAEHQKRMSKKRYLSEHSEYVYTPIPEASKIVEIQDQELIDGILAATLNGENAVKVKRETYNKFYNGKLQQNGD